MGEPPAVCKACVAPIRKQAESIYARSLPMCASCEVQAFKDVRPSPRNRKQPRGRTR